MEMKLSQNLSELVSLVHVQDVWSISKKDFDPSHAHTTKIVTTNTTTITPWIVNLLRHRKEEEHCSVEGIDIWELEKEMKDGNFGDVVSGHV